MRIWVPVGLTAFAGLFYLAAIIERDDGDPAEGAHVVQISPQDFEASATIADGSFGTNRGPGSVTSDVADADLRAILDRLDQKLSGETRDNSWAPQSEKGLRTLLAHVLYPNIGSNFQVSCRKTICRIDGQFTRDEQDLWRSQTRNDDFKILLNDYGLEFEATALDLRSNSGAFRTFVIRRG